MTGKSLEEVRGALLDAALPHVVFDGWRGATFAAAVADSGTDPALARLACPRGGLDLARAYHLRGDALMAEELGALDLSHLAYSARVATAVRLRLELADREAVRRGMTLFALPRHAAEGSRLVWGTADAIWGALGDTSEDLNWYTKRASLAAVFGSTVLYWLGDESPMREATWGFLDRRIAGVLRVEKAKAGLRKAPLVGGLMAAGDRIAARICRPAPRDDLPGRSSGA